MKMIQQLADVVLRGPLSVDSLTARLDSMLEHSRFPRKLATRVVDYFGEHTRPSHRAVLIYLEADQALRKKIRKGKLRFVPENIAMVRTEMAPDRNISIDWKVPTLCSLGALTHWLDIQHNELDWFAGMMGKVESDSKLSHYQLRKVVKKRGGVRVLESPKSRLKQIQRYILHGILNHIPSHHSAHGFVRDRSIVSYVQPHIGKKKIVKFDLKDYFLTVDLARVRSLFHVAGYPPLVSLYLARLCTHSVRLPFSHPDSRRYREYHLPQGAPSSPAIANCLLFKVDVRLLALAKRMGMDYTRYADDMAFSSDRLSSEQMQYLTTIVPMIVAEEGWCINHAKTRVMPDSQQQRLAGLVVNEKANVSRADYDELRAILYRVRQNGLEYENRYGHPHFLEYLQGRIAFVAMVHPKRGEKLRLMLEEVL